MNRSDIPDGEGKSVPTPKSIGSDAPQKPVSSLLRKKSTELFKIDQLCKLRSEIITVERCGATQIDHTFSQGPTGKRPAQRELAAALNAAALNVEQRDPATIG